MTAGKEFGCNYIEVFRVITAKLLTNLIPRKGCFTLIQDLTDNDSFAEIVENNPSIVIEFYASWCKPCEKVFPIVEKLSAEMKDVTFYKVDTDKEPLLTMALGAVKLPTVVFIKDGIVKDLLAGVHPEEQILESIEKIK